MNRTGKWDASKAQPILRFRPTVWDGKSAVTEFVTASRVACCLRGNGRKAN
jgi:hypothetical protein